MNTYAVLNTNSSGKSASGFKPTKSLSTHNQKLINNKKFVTIFDIIGYVNPSITQPL